MIKSKLQKLFFYSILSLSISHSYNVMAQENSVSTQISSLISAGQFEQALVAIESELKNNAKDPVLRFQHGISLAGLGKNDEAIADFTKLTEDYPQLPEPYNNLAVIYAYKGQLEKSRAALEMAIKANPNYVSAHDNLGDVYSKLAANHYEKAVNLDNKNDSARSKLNMLSAIANLPIGSRQVYNGVASSAQAKQAFSFKSNTPNSSNLSAGGLSKQELEKQAKAEKLEKAKAEKAEKAEKLEKAKLEKEQKLKAEKLEKSEKVEKAKKEVEAKPATSSAVVSNSPSKSAPTTSPTPTITAPAKTVATSSNAGDEQEVVKSVNSWASAWSNKNVGSYLGYYSSGFKPNDGSSRAAWEEARKTRIQDKGNIDVSVSNPKVTVSGDTATVTFKQVYKSDKLHDTTQKTLVMVKVNGKWQIKQEKGN